QVRGATQAQAVDLDTAGTAPADFDFDPALSPLGPAFDPTPHVGPVLTVGYQPFIGHSPEGAEGGQVTDRLEGVGLAGAVGPDEQIHPGIGTPLQMGIGPEVGQFQPG